MTYLILLATVFCIIHVSLGALAQRNISNNIGRINKVINKLKE